MLSPEAVRNLLCQNVFYKLLKHIGEKTTWKKLLALAAYKIHLHIKCGEKDVSVFYLN